MKLKMVNLYKLIRYIVTFKTTKTRTYQMLKVAYDMNLVTTDLPLSRHRIKLEDLSGQARYIR